MKNTLAIMATAALVASPLAVQAATFNDWNKAMANPQAVTELQLGEGAAQGWKALPAGLEKFVSLQKLSLSCMEKLESLPASLGELKSLKSISIDNGNGCASNVNLPASIGNLPALTALSVYGGLDGTPPKALPASIAQLKTLEVLDLGRNNLGQVPAFVGSMAGLKELKLDFDGLNALPDSLGNLKALKSLSLTGNSIKRLPPGLASNPGLKVYLGNNSLKKTDQMALRKAFPKAEFFFDNEFDDDAANE